MSSYLDRVPPVPFSGCDIRRTSRPCEEPDAGVSDLSGYRILMSDVISGDSRLELVCNWDSIGTVQLGAGYRLMMPHGIPKASGVYMISATSESDQYRCSAYVGESQDVHNRLTSDYAKSGWEPSQRRANTNRHVHKWIYLGLSSGEAEFQVQICRGAYVVDSNDLRIQLNFDNLYHRQSIEAMTVVANPALRFVNKRA